MTKNVVNELMKLQKKYKNHALKNDVITEVNKLLEYDNHRDLEILRGIGQGSTLVQAEDTKGRALELEKKENFFSGTVFTREQIIELGIKYRLKFLKSKYYKSYIDPTVATEVKELERNIRKNMETDIASKRGITVEELRAEKGENTFKFDAYALKENFYILAPQQCFNLERVSKYVQKVPDPVLFYTDDQKHFRLIKKWGKDFTTFRRIKGIFFKGRKSKYWFGVLTALSLGLIASPFIGLYSLLFLLSFPLWAVITYSPDMVNDYWGEQYVDSTRTFY